MVVRVAVVCDSASFQASVISSAAIVNGDMDTYGPIISSHPQRATQSHQHMQLLLFLINMFTCRDIVMMTAKMN